MTRRLKSGAAWDDIKPHAERWATDPSMTYAEVARLSGRSLCAVKLQMDRHSIKRAPEVKTHANRMRAAAAYKPPMSLLRYPDLKPSQRIAAPRYASIWHLAAGVSVGGGLRNVFEVRT